MKQTITFIALLFVALSAFGQRIEPKIHKKPGKIRAETNLNGSDSDDDKVRQAQIIQNKGIAFQNSWLKSTQATKQRVDSTVFQGWDESTSSWVIFFKEEFTYDANGNMTQSVPYWDEGTGQLVADWKDDYTYNTNGNKTQCLSSKWDETTSKWVQSDKEEYTYDASGNMTQSVEYGWDETNSKWLVMQKLEYIYDANGNMTQSVKSIRVWDTEQWLFKYKHDYTYNANGKMTQSSGYRWDEPTSKWVPIDKIEYTYDASENITQSLYYCWDESSSKFVDCWKEEYTHDDKGNIIENLQYEWDENTPQLIGKSEYTYDTSYVRADLILPYFNDEFSVIEALDIIELFNHKLVSFLGSMWDEAGNQWIPGYKSDYYYSEQNVSSVNETELEISRIYPNPCSEYISFSFSGNFDQITFELFDLQGRKVITKEVRNNETLSLESLDNGIYVFKLFTTNWKIQSGKLIKE